MSYSFGPPPIITDGLVLHLDAANYRSYPGTGTTWSDLSGQGNNGTLTNMSATPFDSDNGGSLVFDGTNDYINCGNSSSLQLSSAITIGSWIKINVISSSSLYFEGVVSMNDRGRCKLWIRENGRVEFADRLGRGSNVVSSISTIPTGSWNNITVTGDSSGLKIYVNGSLDASNSDATYSPNTNVGDFLIGADLDFDGYFDGGISNIVVYNRALTASEVLQNYNSTKGRFGL